jgi:hypothetical protein
MKELVLSTHLILKNKVFNCDFDESWVDWAIDMIEAGFNSENLYVLAATSKPYNQQPLQDLTNKVLQDFNLSYTNKGLVIKKYVYFIVTNAIYKTNSYFKALRQLKDICVDMQYDELYMPFYLLYFAKVDLAECDHQLYWDGADKTNIDQIITTQFAEWIAKYEK